MEFHMDFHKIWQEQCAATVLWYENYAELVAPPFPVLPVPAPRESIGTEAVPGEVVPTATTETPQDS